MSQGVNAPAKAFLHDHDPERTSTNTQRFQGRETAQRKVACIAPAIGLLLAHTAAAVDSLFAIPLLQRWKLQTGAGLDFSTPMHWPHPVPSADLDGSMKSLGVK